MTATSHLLADGRLHLHHGPMDLIVQAWGDADRVKAAYVRAWTRFVPLLEELVDELALLRSPDDLPVSGTVARAMLAAVRPFRPAFITPMAAVAGAVADEVMRHLAGPGITKAYVNNGGDIALHLTPGQTLTAAIAARHGLPDRIMIRHDDPVRGIATSGWRGRSFSRGIADAVTVLAPTAAKADAAATVIANAVDLPGHRAITRDPASAIRADSDLGTIPVTTAVAPLSKRDKTRALAAGHASAVALRARGLIDSAALFLQGETSILSSHPLFLSPNIPEGSGEAAPPRRIDPEGGEMTRQTRMTEVAHG